ncbi:MAG: hypothetical protein HUJ93_00025 [Bacteroidales bacterium]|nr:hypothetical protein [Bacteroidales bacterium]
MRRIIFLAAAVLMAYSAVAADPDGESRYKTFAPDGIPVRITDKPWELDMHGNHRAVIEVPDCEAVSVSLPWRRPDLRIETKKIKVTDAQDNEMEDVVIVSRSAESGSFVFKPSSGAGIYYVYYLPCKFRRGSDDARYGDPWNDYLPSDQKFDPEWLKKASASGAVIQEAKVVAFESLTRFDFWSPMGLVATAAETEALKSAAPSDFVVFPEDRAFPIQFSHKLPVKWVSALPKPVFNGVALRSEYYVWQLGVWAAKGNLKNVKVSFSDFKKGSARIPASEFTCFNQEGTEWDGSHKEIKVDVPNGRVQAMWCGVMIPENARPGTYKGTATVTADGCAPQKIAVCINVKDEVIADHGDSDLWRHARLRWLNSTIALDNEPTAEYEAMTLEGNVIGAGGRMVEVGENGLVKSISINGKSVFDAPQQFIISTSKGDIAFDDGTLNITKDAAGLVSWSSSCIKDGITFNCKANMEFDGNMHYEISVTSASAIEVKDVRLVSGYSAYASEYYIGCGTTGGFRPTDFSWDWNGPYDSYWIGGPLAGLHVEFRGGSYHGPLIADYKPAPTPVWSNEGRGRVSVKGAKNASATVIASTGVNTISSEPKVFEFNMLITPVKRLDPAKHFAEKYFHGDPRAYDKAAEDGANISNIHHAGEFNPYINYPFLIRDSLVKHIDHQHQNGRKVKLYYTIRELTTHCDEVYAFKSLGNEIFADGPGYGLPWECEHLIDGYKPAWYTALEAYPQFQPDAALVVTGNSRFINYWLEGLRWMEENYGLDGIYMDDVSFDRTTVKRIRKILERYHSGARIDLHSNTAYSKGPANQYTEFFPYVDRLWFGESYRYDEMSPDEWFVTFSGIPFGEMSEMLQGGGNRYLGMVYGATARHSWSSASNVKSPVPVWKFWDKFGIGDARMVGYWDADCPVSTSDPEVKATAYVKDDAVLVSIGNFSSVDKTVLLSVDYKALGFDPASVSITAPEIFNFQEERSFTSGEAIPVKSKEGWLIVISKK